MRPKQSRTTEKDAFFGLTQFEKRSISCHDPDGIPVMSRSRSTPAAATLAWVVLSVFAASLLLLLPSGGEAKREFKEEAVVVTPNPPRSTPQPPHATPKAAPTNGDSENVERLPFCPPPSDSPSARSGFDATDQFDTLSKTLLHLAISKG